MFWTYLLNHTIRLSWLLFLYIEYECTDLSPFSLFVFSADYYVKVMKKIQDKGDEYIKNENERLGRILGEYTHACVYSMLTSVF